MVEVDKKNLIAAGVQYGTLVRWRDPRMNQYIYSAKKKRCVLDLDKIVESYKELFAFLREIIGQKKKVIFLGTKKKTSEIVKAQAQKCRMPFVTRHWQAGFFTNHDEVRKKIKELQYLTSFVQRETFTQLPKKQQKKTQKRLEKLSKTYEGLIDVPSLNEVVLFVVGLKKEAIACREARKARIPVIAICNTNANPYQIDQVVLGNDEGVKSVEFIVSLVSEAISESLLENDDSANASGKESEPIPSPANVSVSTSA